MRSSRPSMSDAATRRAHGWRTASGRTATRSPRATMRRRQSDPRNTQQIRRVENLDLQGDMQSHNPDVPRLVTNIRDASVGNRAEADDGISSIAYENVMAKYVRKMTRKNRAVNRLSVTWGDETKKPEHQTDETKSLRATNEQSEVSDLPEIENLQNNEGNHQVSFISFPFLTSTIDDSEIELERLDSQLDNAIKLQNMIPKLEQAMKGETSKPESETEIGIPKSVATIRVNEQAHNHVRKRKRTLDNEGIVNIKPKIVISWMKYDDLSTTFKSEINLNPHGTSAPHNLYICCMCNSSLKTTSEMTGQGLVLCVSCQEWYLNVSFDRLEDECPLYKGRVFFTRDVIKYCFCENKSEHPCVCDQDGGCQLCVDPPIIRRENISVLNHQLIPSWLTRNQFYCKDSLNSLMLENCKFICQSIITRINQEENETPDSSEMLVLSDGATNIIDVDSDFADDVRIGDNGSQYQDIDDFTLGTPFDSTSLIAVQGINDVIEASALTMSGQIENSLAKAIDEDNDPSMR